MDLSLTASCTHPNISLSAMASSESYVSRLHALWSSRPARGRKLMRGSDGFRREIESWRSSAGNTIEPVSTQRVRTKPPIRLSTFNFYRQRVLKLLIISSINWGSLLWPNNIRNDPTLLVPPILNHHAHRTCEIRGNRTRQR